MKRLQKVKVRGKHVLAVRRSGNPTALQAAIQKAKRRLPLPTLLARLGYVLSSKLTMRCPFHQDRKPSFSVFPHEKTGEWIWKCHAGCGRGDAIAFLAHEQKGSRKQALQRYLKLARVSVEEKGSTL